MIVGQRLLRHAAALAGSNARGMLALDAGERGRATVSGTATSADGSATDSVDVRLKK